MGKCHAKYDRDAFSEHLENKKECIYHRLTREIDEMEQGLVNKYGPRVTLYFLMVDCKSELEYRKWATFYMDREKADLLAMSLNKDSRLEKCLT